ncbi:hypothetical protein B7R22_00720 [Subtercola boreus]|uniref:Uncharacterized protein n=2 Tax=Subtercola boreus TaxID=120213 RepID=A0A3E0W5C3_9MICO|nr:hypothetical protein B7R22_00720 [Subtercola boreus]
MAVLFGYALVLGVTLLRVIAAASGGQQDIVSATLVVFFIVYVLAMTVALCPLALRNRRLRKEHPNAVRFTALFEGPTRAGLPGIPDLAKMQDLFKPSAYPWFSVVIDADGIQLWGTSKWGAPPFLSIGESQIRSIELTGFRIIGLPETGFNMSFLDSFGGRRDLILRPGSRLWCYQSGCSRRSAARLLAKVKEIQGIGGRP